MTVTAAQLAAFAALALSLISLGSVIYALAGRLAKLEVKVDTMWGFQMRRAFTEAVDRGVATVNSPLRFSLEARERLKPIEPALHEFWEKQGSKLSSDSDVLLAIEANFGEQLITEVCLPCHLTHGACLLLAYAVATGRKDIQLSEMSLDVDHAMRWKPHKPRWWVRLRTPQAY